MATPQKKEYKYPAVCPPTASELAMIDEQVAEAEPPLYNEHGMAGQKKKPRRGKQAEGGKKRKASQPDDDDDDAGVNEANIDNGSDEADEIEPAERTQAPDDEARKPKSTGKPKATAKKNKVEEPSKKASAEKPAMEGQAAKKGAQKRKAPEPVDEETAEPAKVPETSKKLCSKKAAKAKTPAAEGDPEIPSLEELLQKNAYKPPPHILGNNVYSNAYRTSLKVSNCKETAKKQGRLGCAIFKAHGLVLPDMCGSFRATRRGSNKMKDDKDC